MALAAAAFGHAAPAHATDASLKVDVQAASNSSRAAIVKSAPDGTTAAAWSAQVNGVRLLFASSRPAGGAWSTPARIAAEPSTDPQAAAPIDLVFLPSGAPVLLWANVANDGTPSKLAVARAIGGGEWTSDDIATPTAGRTLTRNAALAVAADGTQVVAWNTRPAPAVAGVRDDLLVAVRPPEHLWPTEPEVLESSVESYVGIQLFPTPTGSVVLAASGTAGAVGATADRVAIATSDGPPRAGTWQLHGASDGEPSGLNGWTDPATLAPDGALWSFSRDQIVTFPGSPNPALSAFDQAGNQVVARTVMPSPSLGDTLGANLGGRGYSGLKSLVFDVANRPVLAYATTQSMAGDFLSYGAPAPMAATRDASGRWSIGPIDAQAETSGAGSVHLARAGNDLVATWGIGVPTGAKTCIGAVFQARRPNGAGWQPRRLVGTTPDCWFATFPQTTEGTDPVVWAVTKQQLWVGSPAEPTTSSVPRFTPHLLTTSWRDLRRGRQLQISCGTDATAVCTASVLRAAVIGGSTKQRAVLQCMFDPITSATKGAHVARLIVGIQARTSCVTRSRVKRLSFVVRLALDRPGRPVQTARLRVALHRP